MSFRGPFLWLRLLLVVLVYGLPFGDYGNYIPSDNLIIIGEAADIFDERDDKNSLDDGLPVILFKDALIQHFNWISFDLDNVSEGVTLELHATGPPNA